MLPTLSGLMISSTQKNTRKIGSSVSEFVKSLLGYIPSPILYGLINHLSGGSSSRWGMIIVMGWTLLIILFLGVAYCY